MKAFLECVFFTWLDVVKFSFFQFSSVLIMHPLTTTAVSSEWFILKGKDPTTIQRKQQSYDPI